MQAVNPLVVNRSTKKDVVIFTTGAYLVPKLIHIEGNLWRWMWIVTSFENDSFMNGDTFNPPEAAESVEQLVVDTTDMDAPIGGEVNHVD